MVVHDKLWTILKWKHVFKYISMNALKSGENDVWIPAELICYGR
jgi:hypothetical protein